jgi:two-component system OmpR family response regulator
MRVLVIEDEPRTQALVSRALRAEGMSVFSAEEGGEGLETALADHYDLVVLDLMLPGMDGISLLRALRSRKPDMPVLIVSARSDMETKLRGFHLGARDYLVKPFSLEELVARVQVQLRTHRAPIQGELLEAGGITLDLARREARVGDRASRLTDSEFRLLHRLMIHAGQTVTRERLLVDAWGRDFDPSSNLVEVGISRLRKKLGPQAPIATIRNVGYRILVD